MNQNYLRAHLALMLSMVLWGSSFIALKIAVTNIEPMVVIFFRMVVGSLAFLAVWPWLRYGVNYQKGDWKYLLGMVLFEPCFYFIFEAQALLYTSAGQAGMITAMLPLMVAIAAYFFLQERCTPRQWMGFSVAIVGVIWMTLSSDSSEQAPNALLGNFLSFLSVCTAVGYTLLVKHLIRRYSAFVLTALQSFTGAIFFSPFALMTEWPETVSLVSVASIVYLGLVITLGAYGLYNYSLTYVKATTAAGYANLLPVFALLFSMLLLGERLTGGQWVAVAIVFVGVLLSQHQKKSIDKNIPPSVTG